MYLLCSCWYGAVFQELLACVGGNLWEKHGESVHARRSGDPLYGLTGQPLENLPGLPGDGGYFLHAQFLKFHHPVTGEQINLEAALPSGFSLYL